MWKHFKNISICSLIIFFSLSFFNGCTSSKLIDVWKDQSYKPVRVKNVLVLAINNNKTKRRVWEKSFVDEMRERGIKAVPSYKFYPNEVPEEKDIPELFKDNYDGIVLIQKVNEENKKYRVPGQVYYQPLWYGGRFRRWYGAGYRVITTPGYVEKETITQIETTYWEPNEDGKMIWSAITESRNPGSPEKFSADVSSLVIPKMISDHIFRVTK